MWLLIIIIGMSSFRSIWNKIHKLSDSTSNVGSNNNNKKLSEIVSNTNVNSNNKNIIKNEKDNNMVIPTNNEIDENKVTSEDGMSWKGFTSYHS